MSGAARFIGQSVARIEDDRILSGRGRYVDDLARPGTLEAAFVRSPMPHARIVSLDATHARSMPGVVAVITAAELEGTLGPLQFPAPIPGYLRPVFSGLADDKVRFVGDVVAIVVADDRYRAEDARDTVEVEYEPLDPVATMSQAKDEERPPLFEDVGSNRFYHETRDFGDPDAAFASAARVVRETVVQQRVTHVPMEGRGGVADYDAGTGQLTYHGATQSPHGARRVIAGFLGHPVERVRVVVPDMGGAFGQKAPVSREDLVLCAAAKILGRAVKWVEDRTENMSSAGHARDEVIEVAAAVADDGTILGLDVKLEYDQGAYPFVGLPSTVFGVMARTILPNAYRIDHLRWELAIYATNKASVSPYRGPWAIETLVREILVDRIARELGLDPVDVRRRNLLTPEEQPRKLITGPTLDGVTCLEALERAARLVDYAGFREEQRRAREQGRLVGVGFATYVEPAPGPADFGAAVGSPIGPERAVARLESNGHLTVITTQAPHGQSHETTIAQVAATELGVPLDHVRVLWGDTDAVPFSILGTGGSRAAAMASGSAVGATGLVRTKVLAIAGNLLEIAPGDLEIVDARVQVKGSPDRGVTLAQVAGVAYMSPPAGEEPDLRSSVLFEQPRGGWSGGTHVCFVEVDPATGMVAITRYVVVEDCGTLINPAVVNGQIRGGVAQGIGVALYENALYDEDANFLASTFMDYLVPTAMEIPPIEIDHLESAPLDEVNFRGVGEGGTIAAPAAVVNAVSDALGGVRVNRLPLTPERVLDLLDSLAVEPAS